MPSNVTDTGEDEEVKSESDQAPDLGEPGQMNSELEKSPSPEDIHDPIDGAPEPTVARMVVAVAKLSEVASTCQKTIQVL